MDAPETTDAAELHYAGENLVPPGSLFRATPDVVSGAERLRIDALAFSADALSHAWNTLREIATDLGSDTDRLTTRQRMAMIMAAWSIVDHLNVVRQIVRSLVGTGEPGPLTERLLSTTETAWKLRNQMDHLNQNAGNLAKGKGKRSALFGSLSYVFVPDPAEPKAFLMLVQTGMIHGSESWKVVNPGGRRIYPPADLFELSAFGMDIELGPPIAAYRDWLAATAIDWEDQLSKQISTLAKSTGKSEEELRAHRGGGYLIAMALNFDSPLEPFD